MILVLSFYLWYKLREICYNYLLSPFSIFMTL